MSTHTANLNAKLFTAASYGNAGLVKKLLKNGAEVDYIDEVTGISSFQVACMQGHTKVAAALIDKKANINRKTEDGYTPLLLAVVNNDFDIVRLLIKAKADLNIVTNEGYNALHIASLTGHADLLRLLLKQNKFDINQVAPTGYTALRIVAESGFADCVHVLIKNPDLDLNKPDESGLTPLHSAVMKDHTSVVEALLLRKGLNDGKKENINYLDIDRTDAEGFSALHIASAMGRIGSARALLVHGAKINTQSRALLSPLLESVLHNHIEISELLLLHHADVNVQNLEGDSPFLLAAEMGQIQTIQGLLDQLTLSTEEYQKTCLLHHNDMKRNVFHVIGSFGQLEVFDILIDFFNETPNLMDLLTTLLTQKDAKNHSPSDLARLSGHRSILSRLNELITKNVKNSTTEEHDENYVLAESEQLEKSGVLVEKSEKDMVLIQNSEDNWSEYEIDCECELCNSGIPTRNHPKEEIDNIKNHEERVKAVRSEYEDRVAALEASQSALRQQLKEILVNNGKLPENYLEDENSFNIDLDGSSTSDSFSILQSSTDASIESEDKSCVLQKNETATEVSSMNSMNCSVDTETLLQVLRTNGKLTGKEKGKTSINSSTLRVFQNSSEVSNETIKDKPHSVSELLSSEDIFLLKSAAILLFLAMLLVLKVVFRQRNI